MARIVIVSLVDEMYVMICRQSVYGPFILFSSLFDLRLINFSFSSFFPQLFLPPIYLFFFALLSALRKASSISSR